MAAREGRLLCQCMRRIRRVARSGSAVTGHRLQREGSVPTGDEMNPRWAAAFADAQSSRRPAFARCRRFRILDARVIQRDQSLAQRLLDDVQLRQRQAALLELAVEQVLLVHVRGPRHVRGP
jgi:hypothetical protein